MNNLQEVWEHCLFCPLCQDVCREMHMAPFLKGALIDNINKQNNTLEFDCQITIVKKSSKNIKIHYVIDLINNSFESKTLDPSDEMTIINMSVGIQGICKKCEGTLSISSSFDMEIKSKTISNFEIAKDSVTLFDENNYYCITVLNYSKQLLVSKSSDKDSGHFISGAIILPFINLDFANPKAVISKIKTLLLFS
jgi:hypothetical protein